MTESIEHARLRAVVEVLQGQRDVGQVAAEHGVSVAEVESWKALFLEGARMRLEAPARRRSLWARGTAMEGMLASGAAVVACVVLFWSTQALSQAACKAGLACFGAGAPALAGEVNGNFSQVVDWIEQKLGSVGSSNVAVPGSASVSGATTLSGGVTVGTGATVNGTTSLNGAATVGGTLGVSSGGGTFNLTNGWKGTANGTTSEISNDLGSYKTLMVIGNTSGGGGVRRVGIWDELTVNGNMNVTGTLVGQSCQARTTSCNADGGGDTIYLDRHAVGCNANEHLTRFRLYGGNCPSNQYQYQYTCCTY